MPSPFTSSFATAAAGNNANGREISGDWYALGVTPKWFSCLPDCRYVGQDGPMERRKLSDDPLRLIIRDHERLRCPAGVRLEMQIRGV